MSEEITTNTILASDGDSIIPTKEPELSDKPIEPHSEPVVVKVNEEAVTTKCNTEKSTDNGIFDFMTPERAIELYKRINSTGIPELDWKFHGRRQPNEQGLDDKKDAKVDEDEPAYNDNPQDEIVDTAFDFDEELGDLQMETSIINESLSLNRRPEPGSDKKINLSDIMSDIMKETHNETE